ncbi:MAG: prepilin-type N-terminal cleavage/methylation domain-containing protein [Betaproteobacteria bacterium]|nr:prepilin-type N-terminal cleavage/methylation domain-containing protein [Betaproteobacteria bacterium]MBI2508879.1 prepilin-type N-terminal cleavage/methylation domain-containing protein [Betaproteobacteria bacterium]
MNAERGFTLIEMAIAIFIIGLLLGGILVPLTTQVEQRQIRDTQKVLEEIKEALVGFAIVNGRLPCPDKTAGAATGLNDTPNDGVEDFNPLTGICSTIGINNTSYGNVPWATLGVAPTDAWGNRFRYSVTDNYARRPPASGLLTLSTAGVIRVYTDASFTTGLTLVSPAVILSHGRNGWGAINSLTNVANAAPASLDELENTDDDDRFVSRPPSGLGAAAGEFDDIVTWLSRSTLMNRMVAAGKLP